MHANYARHYRTLHERHWWWRARESHVLDEIERLHRRGSGSEPWRILDVGCGDGLHFEALARFGHVEGLEPNASLIQDPRWRGRIRVGGLGDGGEPILSQAHDLVLMLDVLEHVADDRQALNEVRRGLKPGGRLLLTVPALPWLWSRHDEMNQHHRRYRRGELRRLLTESGFQVEILRYYFVWTVAPLVLRSWLDPAGRRVRVDREVRIPPTPVNRFLTAATRAEHAMGRRVPFPIGSSLIAVARRDETSREDARKKPTASDRREG